ncbi:MAG: DUF3172 domain-containing protein [Nostoc sp. DedQUE12b]|uniref:DUF3172 domain-containing protein n=1 Tax=unclassified Nostoc TaxID=2593658 RepID=UPI002AD3EB47|nr:MULTISPECIES: DUF3172 domain-containing protein [unclassified Nostoc]MDZ7952878.1 DUF3172 domain-containing protein [Nostoc sp. DedQUE09]MDZ8089386.1 DUF3172 domain-containing protein [Nostoc sp. DedQUE12b]
MRRKSTGRSATTSKPSIFQSPLFNFTTIAIMGGVLILGIGIGIAFSSTATLSPANVASRDFIDTKAPNPEICVQYGASAMVMDARLFVTLSPFNVYVSQPTMRPGCVLRQNNWALLEQRKLVTNDQVRDCKNRLNTFGFTGNLDSDKPDIRCIYQNEAAQNFFNAQPGAVGTPQETDRF